MMENFTQIHEDELQELNGGFAILPILEGLGIIGGLYALVREIVKDAGEAAAYRDLGM